jgi:nanoRNase/pAp phosphatase (c-di-AMP/oligoRNAs hydrolase)
LALEDVKERVDLYKKYAQDFKQQLLRCTCVRGKVVVLDLRKEETIYPGNRFMIYALFPESNVSIHVIWGLKQQNTVFAVGKSIFDRSSKVNIGELMLKYDGGGHAAAGTCQVQNDQATEILKEVVHQLNA